MGAADGVAEAEFCGSAERSRYRVNAKKRARSSKVTIPTMAIRDMRQCSKLIQIWNTTCPTFIGNEKENSAQVESAPSVGGGSCFRQKEVVHLLGGCII